MSIEELYQRLTPTHIIEETAQMLADGLSVNLSGIFDTLIREAARCNAYAGDLFYDMAEINEKVRGYREGQDFAPLFVGFRRYGVDGSMLISARVLSGLAEDDSVYGKLSREYFALYSVMILPDVRGWKRLVFCKYNM